MARRTNSRKEPQPVRRPISICIVASDIGEDCPSENSTAILAIAQKFAATGDSVTLLLARGSDKLEQTEKLEKTEKPEVKQLGQHLFERYLINLVPLPPSKEMLPGQGSGAKQSLAVYHYLKEQKFDAVYFGLEGGVGYFSLLAKETGVFENPPQLLVIAQSPIDWLSEADRFFLEDTQQVTAAYMEKYCAENCDGLVCTSQSVLTWMRRKNWKVSAEAAAILPVLPHELKYSSRNASEPVRRISEIVFLSGPEYHKGLTLLCDALDKAADKLPPDLTITVIGRFGQILGEHTGGILVRRARNWPFALKLLPRLSSNESISYLRAKRALAVFPAYDAGTSIWLSACIREALPFIATNVGSIPELLAAQFHAGCLCDPTDSSLAEKIVETVTSGQTKAAPSRELERTDEDWERQIDLLAAAAGGKEQKSPGAESLPLVSVVLVHHDRPQYLLQAVQSVEQQDYRNLELILVDDGSKLPESRTILAALEPRFEKRGWRILREENRYLGAARNAGARAAQGTHILFLDDDNALFSSAVSTLVRAIHHSGADICTCLHRTFYGDVVPAGEKAGYIQYITLGGSLDIGFLENSFGDANALIRREVFDKIGYQVELFGRTGEDWEFFARATLAGLKLRVVPEPLYWYRSSPRGMWKSSHWYNNRLPTLETFRKHGFKGLEHVYHLALSAHANRLEIESFRENLRYSPSDARFLQLCELNPQSDKATNLLAQIAASEGRPDTALGLLAQGQHLESFATAAKLLETRSEMEKALAEPNSGPAVETKLDHSDLRMFVASTKAPANTEPSFYLEKNPDRLYLETKGQTSVATLPAGIPASTINVSLTIALDQAIAEPTEFIVMAVAMNHDSVLAVERAVQNATDDSSGWHLLSLPHQSKKIELRLPGPISLPMNLVVATRPVPGSDAKASVGCFSDVSLKRLHAVDQTRRPRTGAPRTRLRAREWSNEEIDRIQLSTNYPSLLPLLLFPPEGGLFLRPSKIGPVVAILDEGFPAFARRAVAYVEIAHDDASPFEFAIALTRPDQPADWRTETPAHCVEFSGWRRVAEKFELQEIVLENRQLARVPFDLNLAIRLPKGSEPAPANAYWRKLMFLWDA